MILLLLSLVAADPQSTPTPTPTKVAANSPDKVICKQFPVTGSLVNTYKECKTRREWDMERERLRANGPGIDSCRNAAEGGGC